MPVGRISYSDGTNHDKEWKGRERVSLEKGEEEGEKETKGKDERSSFLGRRSWRRLLGQEAEHKLRFIRSDVRQKGMKRRNGRKMR
jgi:hypothetical protein